MKKVMIKSLVTIAFLIIIFVAIARILGKSETISDYREKHQSVVTPEAETDLVASNAASTTVENVNEASTNESSNISGNNDIEESQKLEAETDNAEGEKVKGEAVADSFYIEEITDELKDYMRGKSYAEGIDETIVNFDMLRHVVIMYNNFEGEAVQGEIVCNEAIAQDLLEIFEELYNAGYQLEEVALVDKYDADDNVSMERNNTSCFNYRVVENTTHLSNHSYGRAIDLNPFYNPYVTYKKDGTEHISPVGSEQYADRSLDFPYKIDENDLAYKLFIQHGFTWGGHWNSSKDYQHFEKK